MDAHELDRIAKLFAGRRFSRRSILRAGGAGLALSTIGFTARQSSTAAQTRDTLPVSGEEIPELTAFDQAMTSLMTTWALPGGQLAVAKDGRLVFNRGYGLADVETDEPVQPDHLFRIASVSKTITTVAILALVDEGKLALDERVFPLLALEPPANAVVDPRLDQITVEHLLVHAGGWDSGATYDPQYLPWSGLAAETLGEPNPAEAETIIRFMLGQPLDFDPGTKSVYSNFGFNVLGRVIEHVSGQRYEDFTRTRVLQPAGITEMRLGLTRPADRAPNEVRYYGPAGQLPRPSVFPGEGYAPVGYGSYYMEALDAHGGWIASAADLARFATAVDGQRPPALLSPASVEAMLSTPRPATEEGDAGAGNAAPSLGLGWVVQPQPNGAGGDWAHAGALEGSNASWLLRTHDGLTIACSFNTLPEDFPGFFGELTTVLPATAGEVAVWPAHDLFSQT